MVASNSKKITGPALKATAAAREPAGAGRPVANADALRMRRRVSRLADQTTDVVGDCPFLCECSTFGDRLVPASAKGPTGRGCRGQTDAYRKKHCKAFACRTLCETFRQALASLKARRAERPRHLAPGKHPARGAGP